MIDPPGGSFRALTPDRLLDTRYAIGITTKTPIDAEGEVDVQVTGRGGVPSTNVDGVILNVTAVNGTTSTHLTVWPTGAQLPDSSNVNAAAGSVTPNLVEVKVGNGGKVTIRNQAGAVHILADVSGYIATPGAGGDPTEGRFHSLPPKRLFDTRYGTGVPAEAVGHGGVLDAPITGVGGVPSSGVSAVVLNVTAVGPTADTHVTVWPTGSAVPTASSLNLRPGEVRPNRVVVKIGSGGKVSFRNNSGAVNLLADVTGWYSAPSATSDPGAYFNPLVPKRLADTRYGTHTTKAPLAAGSTRDFGVAGIETVPSVSTGLPPTAVVLNVTVVNPTAQSHLTVWPSGIAKPDSSDLNFTVGEVRANLVVVGLGADGKVDVANNSGSVDVVVDVLGYFTGAVAVAAGAKILTDTESATITASDSTSVTFSSLPAGLNIGTKLLGSSSPHSPTGVLGVVTALSGGTATLAPIGLNEVLSSFDTTLTGIGGNVPNGPGVGAGEATALPLSFDISPAATARVSGGYSLSLHPYLHYLHNHTNGYGAEFGVSADASIDYNVTFTQATVDASLDVPIGPPLTIPGFLIVPPFFEIEFSFNFQPSVQVTLGASGPGTQHLSGTAHGKAGIRIGTRTGVTPETEFSANGSAVSSGSQTKYRAAVNPGASFSIMIFNLIGPSLRVGPKVEVKTDAKCHLAGTLSFEASLGLTAGLGPWLTATVPIHSFEYDKVLLFRQDLPGCVIPQPRTLPGGTYSSGATKINDLGHVVGYVSDGLGSSRAVLWKDNQTLDLNGFGGPQNAALDINDSDTAVGYSDKANGDRHPFVWTPQYGMVDLGIYFPAGRSGIAVGINDAGFVVGADWPTALTSYSDYRSWWWKDGEPLHYIFDPSRHVGSTPNGISSTGLISLYIWDDGKGLYTGGHGMAVSTGNGATWRYKQHGLHLVNAPSWPSQVSASGAMPGVIIPDSAYEGRLYWLDGSVGAPLLPPELITMNASCPDRFTASGISDDGQVIDGYCTSSGGTYVQVGNSQPNFFPGGWISALNRDGSWAVGHTTGGTPRAAIWPVW